MPHVLGDILDGRGEFSELDLTMMIAHLGTNERVDEKTFHCLWLYRFGRWNWYLSCLHFECFHDRIGNTVLVNGIFWYDSCVNRGGRRHGLKESSGFYIN